MTTSYTVVQHSAWSGKRNPSFQHALESAGITAAQAIQVRRQGGLVFGSYTDAEDYADTEQYQNVEGLIARAPGTFASYRIDGRAVYVPRPLARHDADGQPYIAYFRNDRTTGFVWSGNNDDPVQVTREMGEPIIATFAVSIAQDQATADLLAEFRTQCDRWLEA